MRGLKVAFGALVALFGTVAASAADLSTTVTATGSYNGDLAVLNDGIVPANGSNYNTSDKVSFTSTPASFLFDFGGQVSVEGLLANVDNNDFYTFQFFNGADLVGMLNIGPDEGSVNFGVETFNRLFGPLTSTSALVTASGGDNLYGIGEVQFQGSALTAAVPEPATWMMMLLGFGVVGAAARRRTRLALIPA